MSEQSLKTLIEEEEEADNQSKVGFIIGGIVLLGLFVTAVFFLVKYPDTTRNIRDIFLIFLGFELAVIGIASILLAIQIARLVNMFQHEIKPVLDAANETMSTLRGTAIFMSDSFVQPVIKLNSQFASIRQAVEILRKLVKK
jgi:membrane protein implicated in regulation of membrane protease activity